MDGYDNVARSPTITVVEHADPREAKKLYRLYFLLGCGTLFPYNAFITAADYFDSLYPVGDFPLLPLAPPAHLVALSLAHGRHTDRLITLCYLSFMLVVLSAIVCNKQLFPRRPLIIGGMSGFLLSMAVIPVWSWVSAASLPLAVVLAFACLTGISDALVQSALFGEAALLPEKYTQGLVSGTAASGACVSVLRIITKAALHHTPEGLKQSTGMYFLSATLVCAGCLYVYIRVLRRIPLYQHYLSYSKESGSNLHLLDPAAHRSTDTPFTRRSPTLNDDSKTSVEVCLTTPGQQGHNAPYEAEHQDAGVLELEQSQSEVPHRAAYWVVGRRIWRLVLSLVIIYTLTLSIFPGFLAEDVSSAWLSDWYPVILITLCNFGDLAGKEMPAWGVIPEPSEAAMLLGAISRTLFVPAFYCAARWGGGPVLMGALTLALGVSNGYLTAVTMMACPRGLQGMQAELAGNISILSLVVGLCIGAACSFLWLL